MKTPPGVTQDNQHDPEPARSAYLRGVIEEALHQGYSATDTGRLVVIAIRARERK